MISQKFQKKTRRNLNFTLHISFILPDKSKGNFFLKKSISSKHFPSRLHFTLSVPRRSLKYCKLVGSERLSYFCKPPFSQGRREGKKGEKLHFYNIFIPAPEAFLKCKMRIYKGISSEVALFFITLLYFLALHFLRGQVAFSPPSFFLDPPLWREGGRVLTKVVLRSGFDDRVVAHFRGGGDHPDHPPPSFWRGVRTPLLAGHQSLAEVM